MKLIIAGSRFHNDEWEQRFKEGITYFTSKYPTSETLPSEIVSGTARGFDKVGEAIADVVGVPIQRFPADWDTYGKSAGYRRNCDMAFYADELLAFWDGVSKGTKHMIETMQLMNKPVQTVMING